VRLKGKRVYTPIIKDNFKFGEKVRYDDSTICRNRNHIRNAFIECIKQYKSATNSKNTTGCTMLVIT
jgi:hypothetical protein